MKLLALKIPIQLQLINISKNFNFSLEILQQFNYNQLIKINNYTMAVIHAISYYFISNNPLFIYNNNKYF